jgi:hypothetical protein
MTVPESVTGAERSLARDFLYAARYYLGNRWALLALGGLAIIAGLTFGGWSWLVAAGLAPVILSTLPCLLMCAFGVCMACRSNRTQSTASRDVADTATSPNRLDLASMDQSMAGSSVCPNDTDER